MYLLVPSGMTPASVLPKHRGALNFGNAVAGAVQPGLGLGRPGQKEAAALQRSQPSDLPNLVLTQVARRLYMNLATATATAQELLVTCVVVCDRGKLCECMQGLYNQALGWEDLAKQEELVISGRIRPTVDAN